MSKNKGFFLKLIVTISLISATFFYSTTCATESGTYGGLKPKETIPTLEKLIQGKLDNGLRYYIYENRKPEGRAALTLAVNAGAVLEDDDENGLAHFVEHMAFNGTERFSESEVVDYLRSLGMRFGADANAYTTADQTVYEIEVPVETDIDGIKRIPVKALDIIDDWMYAITFEPEAVNDERPIIMEEYRLRRFGAMGRQQKVLSAGLLAGSRYAERDVIGLPEVIENAPAQKLKGFYKKWYKPENMAIILVGDFDGAALEKKLAGYFNAPASDTPFVHPEYSLPPPKKNDIKIEIFTDPELSYTQIALFYKQKYIKNENTIAEYKKMLVDNLISRMLDERFGEAALNPQTSYVTAGASFFSMVRPSNFYTFSLASKPKMTGQSLDELLLVKESVKRYGFSGAEIERAKQSLLSDFARLAAEKEKSETSFFSSKLTYHYLDNTPIPDFDWELATAQELLPFITKNEIHNAVKNYFLYEDVFIFISAPEDEAPYIPAKADIMRKAKNLSALKIEKPDEVVFDSQLLDKAPERGGISEEIIHEDTGIVEWKLDNGATVMLKNTTNKNDNIELYAISRGGTAAAPPEDAVSANLAAELFSASGVGTWTRSELVKKLSGKQVSFSFNTNDFTRNITGSSNTADLKTLFELIYLSFTGTKIDQNAFSVVLDEYRTILAQRSKNPEAVFDDEVQKIIYSDNPRFMPLTVDDLSKLSADKALAFLEKCFNPADYTFIITGNIDIKTMKYLVETYIASIPEKTNFDQWAKPVPPIQRPGKTEVIVRKGQEDKGYVFSGRFISKTFDENTGLVCKVLSEYLDIVLVESVREKLGGAYSIGASASLSPVPPDGELVFEVFFACNPKRALELNLAVEAELAKIAAGNINADTFDKARKALIKNWEQSMQSNAFLSRTFANYRVVFDIPESRLYERPRMYESLRQSDMQNLMKQILQKGAVTVILYPAN
ncbi:MAG: insulinase family protein [Spirochaetaceae bacterium]|nr:insulinase family protein [Spirochaetaceae bacterium]